MRIEEVDPLLHVYSVFVGCSIPWPFVFLRTNRYTVGKDFSPTGQAISYLCWLFPLVCRSFLISCNPFCWFIYKICIHLCVCGTYGICAHVHMYVPGEPSVHTCEKARGNWMSCSVTLCLIPLWQGLPLISKLNCWPADPSDPAVSALQHWGSTYVWPCLAVCECARIRLCCLCNNSNQLNHLSWPWI